MLSRSAVLYFASFVCCFPFLAVASFTPFNFNYLCQQKLVFSAYFTVSVAVSVSTSFHMARSSHHDFLRRKYFFTGPAVLHGKPAVLSEEMSQDGYFDVDIDKLEGQLGIDQIMQSLNSLNKKCLDLSGNREIMWAN